MMFSKVGIGLVICFGLCWLSAEGKTSKETLPFDEIYLLVASGNLEKAAAELEQYRTNKKTETEYFLLKGLLSFSLFEFDQSMVHFNEAEKLINSSENPVLNHARLNHFKGVLFLKGFYKSEIAIDYLKVAEEIYKVQRPAFYYLADIYFQLGRAYKDLPDVGAAKYYILKSLEMYEGKKTDFPVQVADNLNALGVIATGMNEPEESLMLFRQAVEMVQRYQRDHLLLSKIYDNMGFAYLQMDDVSARLIAFRKSIAIAKKYAHGKFWISNSYLNMGEHFLARKEIDSSLYYFRKCLKERIMLFGEKNYESSVAFEHIAISFKVARNFDSASFYLDKAFAPYSYLLNLNASDLGKQGKDEQLQSINILSQKTQMLIEDFLGDSLKIDKLKKVHSLFKRMDNLAREFNKNFFWDASHSYVYELLKYSYEDAIYTAYLLYQTTRDESYAIDAFGLIESNKSQLFLQNLSITKTVSGNPEAKKMRAMELSLKRKLTDVQLHSSLPVDPAIQKRMVLLSDSLSSLFELIKKSDKNYYLSRFQEDFDAKTALQVLSEKKLSFIEFYYGRDAVFNITIDASGVKDFQRIIRKNQMDTLMTYFLSMVSNIPKIEDIEGQAIKYKKVSSQLYTMLLAKPLSMLTTKEVIIIPDGLLFKLPFEALTMPQSKGFSFARLAYVQKEYLISYAYSCYTLLKEKNPVRLNNVTSVFGNSSLEGATNNISSYAEVQALSDFLVLRKYLGAEATKAAVFRSLQEDRQVHFALHGKASIVEGKSAIVLPGNDTLFAYEIYERPINADLVHLNACETMAGANNASEGIISLARAFIFSGVQSVVSNLWLVDDTNARTLAIDFYKQLSKGISPANALAQAKRKAIGEGDQFTAHPYYWAGTILIGQPNRQVDSRWNYWLVVLLSMIFIITGVMLKKRFTTNS